MSETHLRSLAALALTSLTLAACALQTSSSGAPAGGSGGGTTSSSGAGGEPSFTSSTSTGGFDACASSSQDAARVPVSMFITVDKSGSMADDGKWPAVKQAFGAFFADPGAADLGVALRLFPRGLCSTPVCDHDACATPDVALGALSDPGQVDALIDELASVSPSGKTPMSTALRGATEWAMKRADAVGKSERVVVILVTDGEPKGCITDVEAIAGHAAKAYDTAGVLTFAVGLAGSNEATMNLIAEKGHTGQGFFIGNTDTQSSLVAALQAIQTQSASCVYALPEAAGGDPVDPLRVNVTFEPSGAASPETLGQVPGAASCGSKRGWYYDDPATPRFITLCPASCDAAKADGEAKVRIVLGCATQIR